MSSASGRPARGAWLTPHVADFDQLRLADAERDWLGKACPYFTPEYLQYLSAYRFKVDQVRVEFLPVSADGQRGHLDIHAVGPWVETILWEVPLMACLSELYFRTVDTDWSYDGQDGEVCELRPFCAL